MKKIIAGIGGVTVLAVLGAVGFVAMQPGAIELTRSVTVAGSPADVASFAHDLRKVNVWSPWRDVDPDLTNAYSETTTGVGAWYSWSGNDDAGEGKQTIVVAEEAKVVHELHFLRPFEDKATSTITWTGDGNTTTVTWAFHQEATFMTKAANLVMDIEGMLGGDYEKGLADLKPLVEQRATKRQAAEQAQKAADDAALAADDALEAANDALKAAQAAAEAAAAAAAGL